MNYIVAYTLKHKEEPNLFQDRWMPFLEDNGCTIVSAEAYYNDIVETDGGEDGWYLFTINMSTIIKSSDYNI